MVEVNKVNKQGKDCEGSCTAALCVTNKVKYPEPFHITIPISSWKPIASNCSYLCRDGYVERCMVLYFVCGTQGSGIATFTILSLFAYFVYLY